MSLTDTSIDNYPTSRKDLYEILQIHRIAVAAILTCHFCQHSTDGKLIRIISYFSDMLIFCNLQIQYEFQQRTRYKNPTDCLHYAEIS